MMRKISFTDAGDIRIEGETSTDLVRCGVVLLTREQADEAMNHGWEPFGSEPSATEPPLYAVRRGWKFGVG